MNYKQLFHGAINPSFKKISNDRWVFWCEKTKTIYYSIDKQKCSFYLLHDCLQSPLLIGTAQTLKSAARKILKEYYRTFYGAYDFCFSVDDLLNALSTIN